MIKDILVHLDDTPQDRVRLAYADNIATSFEAHVTALFVNLIPQIVLAGDGGMMGVDMAVDVENEARTHGDDAMAELKTLADGLTARHQLRRLDVHSELAGQTLASEARMADLFVATRPYGHDRESITAGLIEGVLFDSGLPCLFVPPDGTPRPSYANIVIAWKDSRQAVRAVSGAMPFLHKARAVTVLLVDDGKSDPETAAARANAFTEHLKRHDLPVTLKPVTRRDKVSSTLLEEAAGSGADLLVMGGYGHSRLREWVLGGTTRAVLSQASLPVFVGH